MNLPVSFLAKLESLYARTLYSAELAVPVQLRSALSARPSEWEKGKGSEGEQDGDDDTPRNPDKRRRTTDCEPASHRTLACPFWKYNPYTKYRSCGTYTLKRIRDVKQHLTRRHMPTLYCQVCYVIFQERDRLEEHIETRSCRRTPGSKLDGISPTTDRILRGRSNPKLSTEQQWFDIWNFLFPDKPRPFSSYNDPVLSAHIGDFREYWQNHCPRCVGRHNWRTGEQRRGRPANTCQENPSHGDKPNIQRFHGVLGGDALARRICFYRAPGVIAAAREEINIGEGESKAESALHMAYRYLRPIA